MPHAPSLLPHGLGHRSTAIRNDAIDVNVNVNVKSMSTPSLPTLLPMGEEYRPGKARASLPVQRERGWGEGFELSAYRPPRAR